MAHRTDPHDRVPRLQVTVRVPCEGRDPITRHDTQLKQGIRQAFGTAVDLAAAHAGKAGDTLATIKARMYAPALATLRDTTNPLG